MSLHLRGTAAANLPRRRFLQGVSAAGALASVGVWKQSAAASAAGRMVLRGTDFKLDIGATPVNYTGAARTATTVNGQVPAPIRRWREGDTVTLRVTNHLAATSSIHWHGIVLPNAMDGIPGLTFKGIAPGETFVCRFPVKQSGTYWYHGHSGFQEQTGLYGAIVIDPRDGERFPADREHVVMLSDCWLKADGERTAGRLGATRTEALWDRTFATYWSTQLGVPHDFGDGAGRNWAALGSRWCSTLTRCSPLPGKWPQN